jgi:guanylate kinase
VVNQIMNKAIIISAPSGAGKTTIVKALLEQVPQLEFSVSACTRTMRNGEVNGRDYWFISPEEFRKKIDNEELVEWQEVYPGSFYGTLKTELERIWSRGHTVIFEVDAIGGINLKKYFGKDALAVFIRPPSIETLEERLRNRNTDNAASIEKRMRKARYEISFADNFDEIVVNDKIDEAIVLTINIVTAFLAS